MEIHVQHAGDLVEMHLQGMLDNNWSDHLDRTISDAVRLGSHRILLNLGEVTYLSSAGISSLLRAHKQLQAIHGFFGVCDVSPHVHQVLRMTGLTKMLIVDGELIRQTSTARYVTSEPQFRIAVGQGFTFEVYDLEPGSGLNCRIFGNPEHLISGGITAEQCRTVSFPTGSLGLGLGAFGGNFDDCQDRFGEFLAVAGTAAQLPTQGGGTPDYQIAQGDYVPEVQGAYGLRCKGDWAHIARFEPDQGATSIPLSALAEQCIKVSGAAAAGIVMIAESAGLVGAALKKSPALAATREHGMFEHPEVRDWLSFSTERVFPRSRVLIVGVATRDLPSGPLADLAPLVRPLNAQGTLFGHFHAAAFSYHPVKKGRLDLHSTVHALFENEELQGILHLLCDRREITGAGESELVSGACWISPLTNVQKESD